LRPFGGFDYRAHQVAFIAPQLKQAAPVLLAYRIAGRAHVEEHTPIFEHRRGGVFGQVFLNALRKLICCRCGVGGGHRLPLPALPRAQAGDVRGVVARVPVVDRQHRGQVLPAMLGMLEALVEIIVCERLQQGDPAGVQRLNPLK